MQHAIRYAATIIAAVLTATTVLARADHDRPRFSPMWARRLFLSMRGTTGAPTLGVCLPEGIHSFEVIETFLDFAKAHPEDLGYNPSFLIYWSMLDKYPCTR